MDIVEATSGSRGGPRTPEGKARTRINALTHGMTAVSLIEEVVGEQQLIETEQVLLEELRPIGFVQQEIVRQLARDTLAMELTGLQIRAIARQASQCLSQMNGSTFCRDAILQALAEAPAFALAQRYHAAAVGRFHRGLLLLSTMHPGLQPKQSEADVPSGQENLISGEKLASGITFLRGVFSNGAQTDEWLLSLLKDQKSVEYEKLVIGGSSTVEGSGKPMAQVVDGIGINQLEEALHNTFLDGTHLPRNIVLGLAAEVMADPGVSLSRLRERIGVKRRQTLQRFCRRVRQNGETRDDWVLEGLRKELGQSMKS